MLRCIPPTEGGIHLSNLSNFLGPPQFGAGSGEGRRAAFNSQAVTEGELVTGTSFALTAEASGGAGGLVSLWGCGAVSRFDGREGYLSLDGEVVSAMLGCGLGP